MRRHTETLADSPRAQSILALAVLTMAFCSGYAADHDLIPGMGDQWPTWRGPFGNGQAIDCADPLVYDIAKARVAWVSEAKLPGPTGDCHRDCNIMGSPIVANDRVYVFYYRYLDEVINLVGIEQYNKKNKAKPQNQIDPKNPTSEYKVLAEDHLLCMDFKTGKTLWDVALPKQGINWNNLNWAARFQHLYAEGRIFLMGTTGAIYGIDAASGKVVWQSDLGKEVNEQFVKCAEAMAEGKSGFTLFGLKSACSGAPAYIDGVVVFGFGNSGYAFNARTGERMWEYEGMYGGVAIEVMAWHQEGHPPSFISPIGGVRDEKGRKGWVAAIDAHSGKELWSVDIGEVKAGNDPKLTRKGNIIVVGTQIGLAAIEVKDGKGRHLWTNPDIDNYRHQAPIIHGGYVYTFRDRVGAGYLHQCSDLKTGKVVASFDKWVRWRDFHAILSNDRLFTFSGVVKADPQDYRPLVPQAPDTSARFCPLPLTDGVPQPPIIYMCPLIVDGYLIAHCSERIVCWDLREPAEQ